MTGYRVATTGSTDRKMDCYAVVGSGVVRILVGGRNVTGKMTSQLLQIFSCDKSFHFEGTYELVIQNLSSLGLATSGSITVHTYQFSWSGTYTNVSGKKDLGTVAHSYSGNSLSFPIYQTDTTTTWAFEFAF